MSRNKRSGPSGRGPTERVKTAKRRKTSSTRWLKRQLNDPYVRKAQADGYRSRAAYKLLELDERLRLIRPGMMVLDLGAAPGGWCQVALEKKAKAVIALDLLPVDPLPGMTFLQMDFMADEAPAALLKALNHEKPDIVLSDMSPNTTGHKGTDHIRIMALAEAAYDFAAQVLKPGGSFIAKVFQGGSEKELLARLKQDFAAVRHIKPPASRKESAEVYVVATGFRG